MRVRIRRTVSTALSVGVALTGATSTASVATAELPSALVISKSSNKNQVHYAIQVDGECAPVPGSPVRPYWRMLERGPDVTEPLRDREISVLGVDRQEVEPGVVVIALRGMRGRPIAIHTSRGSDGRCTSSADMAIAGVPAHLVRIYVQQKLFGVQYVLLTGMSADGAVLNERVLP